MITILQGLLCINVNGKLYTMPVKKFLSVQATSDWCRPGGRDLQRCVLIRPDDSVRTGRVRPLTELVRPLTDPPLENFAKADN
jgi:hypothetical protein